MSSMRIAPSSRSFDAISEHNRALNGPGQPTRVQNWSVSRMDKIGQTVQCILFISRKRCSATGSEDYVAPSISTNQSLPSSSESHRYNHLDCDLCSVVVGPQIQLYTVLENPPEGVMTRLTALFGSVFACFVLATSAAPGTHQAEPRRSPCSIRRSLEHISYAQTSCLSCSSHQDELGLAPRRADYSARSVSELSAVLGSCNSWGGFSDRLW